MPTDTFIRMRAGGVKDQELGVKYPPQQGPEAESLAASCMWRKIGVILGVLFVNKVTFARSPGSSLVYINHC